MRQVFHQIIIVASVGTGFLLAERAAKACICETGEIISW